MSWNLQGQRVSGLYIGSYLVTGTVMNSRVRYGGEVSHTVKIDRAISDSKLGFSYDAGETVNIHHKNIREVLSN